MAHKLCPRCSTPAPIEDAFCNNCGRQYRTKFVAETAHANTEGAAHPRSAGRPFYSVGVIAFAVLLLVLIAGAVIHRRQSDQLPSIPQFSAPRAQNMRAPVQEPEHDQDSEPEPSTSDTTSDGDDRIQLRGGGSITRSQWEEAQRHVENSGVPVEAPAQPRSKPEGQDP